jgi:hypothetical protein
LPFLRIFLALCICLPKHMSNSCATNLAETPQTFEGLNRFSTKNLEENQSPDGIGLMGSKCGICAMQMPEERGSSR